MYVNPKLKLNKFVHVAIPKNCDYFRRFQGNLQTPPTGLFSGDSVVPSDMTKTEQLSEVDRYNSELLSQEKSDE